MIDIDTKLVTLIGTPLAQSHAAAMHNYVYEKNGINMRYFYTEADASQLGNIVNAIRCMPSFCGAAVTKPCKTEVIKYLDELCPECQRIGACNTIVKLPDGKLRGYNTDVCGFMHTLSRDMHIDPNGKSFFCIGAGGAARAICSALAENGARRIYVVSRSYDTTSRLSADLSCGCADIITPLPPESFGQASDCDVVINASGVGMGESVGESPMPREYFVPDKLYFDACYEPVQTQFLKYAEAAGGKPINGLGMSIYQAAEQIKLWSGKTVSFEQLLRGNEEYEAY